MRKKYLSALLFGALLFASAGTFTSCKDYDDDINNLQEQINTINTTLEELTSKINGLGAGVTDFKYENGKLVIVTDKGTNFEVTLPEADGIKELEIKDGILYADGEKVGVVAGEGGAVNVEVKDGILYINGEAQELNDEVGSKVVVVDNGNGTYTLTVDGTSIVLPKASVSVDVKFNTDARYFTNVSQDGKSSKGGIKWATADKYRGNWGGLKAVEKGKLLVGQISTIQIKTLSATFDLENSHLTLVNTLGEEAPVVVTPVAEGKKGPSYDNNITRAADANGIWDLKIEMKSDVTADNIDVIFATLNSDNQYKNVKYALAVDGRVVTDYDLCIDTDESKTAVTEAFEFGTTKLMFKVDGEEKNALANVISSTIEVESSTARIPIGKSTTLYLASNEAKSDDGTAQKVDYIYDSYIEIDDKDMAEEYGISAKGMTLDVSSKAASLNNLPLIIHVLDINGNEVESKRVYVNFAASVAAGDELKDQVYTVMPSVDKDKQFILIDLGTTFTGLTSEEAVAISTDKQTLGTGTVTWYSVAKNNLFKTEGTVGAIDALEVLSANSDILYYTKKEDALKYGLEGKDGVSIDFNSATVNVKASTIREIAYAVVPFDNASINNDAKANVKTPFTLILKDKNGNEIRKASAHFELALPTFDQLLEANTTQNLWNEGVFKARLTPTGADEGQIKLASAFVSKNDGTTNYIDLNSADGLLSYELAYKDFDEKDQYVDVTSTIPATLDGKIVKDGKLLNEDINATATLSVYGTSFKNLQVTKEFKIDLMSIFEGAELAYYVGGKPVDGAMVLESYRYIYSGKNDNKNNPDAGLYVKYNGEIVPFFFNAKQGPFTNGVEILATTSEGIKALKSELTIATASDQTQKQVVPFIYKKDGALGDTFEFATPEVGGTTRGSLDLGTLEEGTSGAIEITFVDFMGVQTTATLDYTKVKPAE